MCRDTVAQSLTINATIMDSIPIRGNQLFLFPHSVPSTLVTRQSAELSSAKKIILKDRRGALAQVWNCKRDGCGFDSR